jgi:hypothetical protein
MVTQDPRPDLLEKIRCTFMSVYGLQAEWKVGKGSDRTRRIHFQIDTFAQAEVLLPKVSGLLNKERCPFRSSFIQFMALLMNDFHQ